MMVRQLNFLTCRRLMLSIKISWIFSSARLLRLPGYKFTSPVESQRDLGSSQIHHRNSIQMITDKHPGTPDQLDYKIDSLPLVLQLNSTVENLQMIPWRLAPWYSRSVRLWNRLPPCQIVFGDSLSPSVHLSFIEFKLISLSRLYRHLRAGAQLFYIYSLLFHFRFFI